VFYKLYEQVRAFKKRYIPRLSATKHKLKNRFFIIFKNLKVKHAYAFRQRACQKHWAAEIIAAAQHV
jgi:hypothetical protein